MSWSEPPVCPQCGAVMRIDASWCTLCHASFRTEQPADDAVAQQIDMPDPLTAPLYELVSAAGSSPPAAARPKRGKHAAGPVDDGLDPEIQVPTLPEIVPGPIPGPVREAGPEAPRGHRRSSTTSDALDDDAVDAMLAMLAAEHAETNTAVPLAGMLEDKSTRVFVIMGGMVVMTAVFFVGIAILGIFT